MWQNLLFLEDSSQHAYESGRGVKTNMETMDLTTPLPEFNSVTESENSFALNSEFADWNDSCPFESKMTIPAEFVHKYLYSSFHGVLCTILMPISICLGCLLNGSFLYVVASIKSMQTTTNFYLANLAVCDMLYLLSTSYEARAYIISGTVTRNTLQDGHISCVMLFFENLFYIASMAFVTLVTMERFVAICYPIKSLSLNRRSRTIKLAVGAWVLNVLVAFLYTIRYLWLKEICFDWPDEESFAHLPNVVGWCSGSPIPKRITVLPVIIRGCKAITFLVIFTICSFMCIKIITALGKRPETGAAAASRAERARLHVARMLLINNAVFFIGNIPSAVVHICRLSSLITGSTVVSEDTITTIGQTAIVCTLINSAVNPIIYNGSNPRYRRAFRQAFTACVRSRRDGKDGKQASQLSTVDQRKLATSTSKAEDTFDNK
ncbi:somatostatin receptor type 5-like [Patiria miniata]|uniref:G-protein coupled receptors family 1 profile domain-containing protein n=1 Tax=Patiria miniata TaxID=46514 RepID=A0A914BC00_PATMI|nr:somatostatin receptor type 5-like [Patiria miniata]